MGKWGNIKERLPRDGEGRFGGMLYTFTIYTIPSFGVRCSGEVEANQYQLNKPLSGTVTTVDGLILRWIGCILLNYYVLYLWA